MPKWSLHREPDKKQCCTSDSSCCAFHQGSLQLPFASVFFHCFNCFGWMCLPKFACWNPNVQNNRIRRWAFGRCLVREGWNLRNQIQALMKENATEIPSLFHHVRIRRCLPPTEGPHLISVRQPPERREVNSVTYELPSPWYFVIAAHT